MGYGIGGGSRIPDGSSLLFPQRPDQVWDSRSLLSMNNRDPSPEDIRDICVKLTTHLHVVQGSTMVELHLQYPTLHHSVGFS